MANYPCPGAGPGHGTFHGPPDPSKPALWSFFTTLYGELAELFPDPYVSVGGDEAWLTPWTCSPAVIKWMKANGFDTGSAARYYEQRLEAIVTLNGTNSKRTMMWAPGESTVDSTQVHIVWSGWPQNGPLDGWKHDFYSFTKQGQEVVLSGPWYLTPSHPAWDQWPVWYHTDPGNFSGNSTEQSLVPSSN